MLFQSFWCKEYENRTKNELTVRFTKKVFVVNKFECLAKNCFLGIRKLASLRNTFLCQFSPDFDAVWSILLRILHRILLTFCFWHKKSLLGLKYHLKLIIHEINPNYIVLVLFDPFFGPNFFFTYFFENYSLF